MGSRDAVSEAWRAAAEDLGIRVTAPFLLEGTDGTKIIFAAFVHDFGGPAGAIAGLMEDLSDAPTGMTQQSGPFVSWLNHDQYCRYDRALFIETLDDWGWFGDGVPPQWYSGGPRARLAKA